MGDTQVFGLNTFAGIRRYVAPAGWRLNETDKHLWVSLVQHTRRRTHPSKLKRDEYVLDGQIEVLAGVLATSLGMASHYWMMKARDLCQVEVSEVT